MQVPGDNVCCWLRLLLTVDVLQGHAPRFLLQSGLQQKHQLVKNVWARFAWHCGCVCIQESRMYMASFGWPHVNLGQSPLMETLIRL